MDKICHHEPDFRTAGIALREDARCDLGVECRLCREHGFAIVTADGIKWNDDD
jgi:hypothetical protein